MEEQVGTEPRWPSLASFIRANVDAIFAEWKVAVRAAVPAARPLSDEDLLDRLPRILERIADLADGIDSSYANWSAPPTTRHAIERLEEGYSLGDMVTEYALLRAILYRRWVDAASAERGFEIVNRIIDEAITLSVDHYARASQRMLSAVDRIATEALGTEGLDSLLDRLLRVLMEASPTIDEAAILLREGDRLVARAASGFVASRDGGFSVRVGEGFAGRIAETREPMGLRDAAQSGVLASEYLRGSGVRALYGVPLVVDGDVIGVAHMGSLQAYDFPEENRMLFRAMATRAAAFIEEARLRERERRSFLEAERGRAMLEGILGATQDPIAVVGRDGTEISRSAATGPPLGGTLRRHVEQCIDHEVACSGEVTAPVPGLGARTFEYTVSPIARRQDDELPTAVIVSRDVTGRRRRDRDRERLIGVLGHDLRSPVSAIQISAEQLLRGPSDERITTVARRIASTADRMERLIEQLVDFARGRLGSGIPIRPVPSDMRAIILHVVEEQSLAHPARRIEVDLDEDMRGELDPDRAAQVISNLLGNALQHGADPVRVVGRATADRIDVEVTNRGPPIASRDLPTLFEPFKERRSGRRGLGLGLYIVSEILRAHGGTITVESTAEETAFATSWPRRRR